MHNPLGREIVGGYVGGWDRITGRDHLLRQTLKHFIIKSLINIITIIYVENSQMSNK